MITNSAAVYSSASAMSSDPKPCSLPKTKAYCPDEHMPGPIAAILKGVEQITCPSCAQDSHPSTSHRLIAGFISVLGHTMASGTAGLIILPLFNGNRQFLTVVDIVSRLCIAVPIATKTEVLLVACRALLQVSGHFGRAPRLFQSDNAEEYTLRFFKDFSSTSTNHSTAVPYLRQINTLAELIICIIFNVARSALSHTELRSTYLEGAVLDAVFKINYKSRTATSATQI